MLKRFPFLGFPWRKFLKHKLVRLFFLLVALSGLAWGGMTAFAWWNYQAAQRALDRDDLDTAQERISRTLALWPHHAKAHFLAARIGRLRHAFQEAEFHLNACQTREGATEPLQLEWLLLRFQAGEISEIEAGLWNCLKEKHPESPWILEALARTYIRELRFHLANRCLADWLALQPDHVRALTLRAGVRELLEYREGALADYQRVVELNPDDWKGRLRLADLLLSEKKTVAALQHLEVVAKTHADSPDYRFILGKGRTLEGKIQEARDLFEKVVAVTPKNPQAHLHLGQIELQEGRPAEAERYFRNALEIDPTCGQAYYSLSVSLLQQNQNDKAQRELQNYQTFKKDMEHLKKHLDDFEKTAKPHSLVEAGDLITRRGNADLGRQFLLRALEMDPANRKAHQLLFAYYTQKNQTQKAAQHRKYLEESKN
jgi:tetratricopeptide (TPR) repeat protein